MKQTKIVTENEASRQLLSFLLHLPQGAEIVSAGGRSSADSLARSFLLNSEYNVALILDAATRNPGQVEEQRYFYRESLAQVAVRSQWQLFLMVPELAAVFFHNQSFLKLLTGKEISDIEFVRGQFEPKQTLQRLVGGKSLADIYQMMLQKADISPLRQVPEIRQMQQFLDRLTQKAAA